MRTRHREHMRRTFQKSCLAETVTRLKRIAEEFSPGDYVSWESAGMTVVGKLIGPAPNNTVRVKVELPDGSNAYPLPSQLEPATVEDFEGHKEALGTAQTHDDPATAAPTKKPAPGFGQKKEDAMSYEPASWKVYKCTSCGTEKKISTNHHGDCLSATRK